MNALLQFLEMADRPHGLAIQEQFQLLQQSAYHLASRGLLSVRKRRDQSLYCQTTGLGKTRLMSERLTGEHPSTIEEAIQRARDLRNPK